MQQNIYLNHDIIQSGLPEQGFAVYVALTDLCHDDESTMYISLAQIHYILTKKPFMSRSTRDQILVGIDQLCEEKLISISKAIGKSEFILDVSKLMQREEKRQFYDVIYSDEIRNIMNISDVNNFMLLRYFCIIVSTFDFKHKYNDKNRVVGFQTVDILAEMCDIRKPTAIKYNRILEAYDLIYVHHRKGKSNNNTEYDLVNAYSRYEDKGIF